MYHDVLAYAPDYRRKLDEACAEYDAMLERDKQRPKGRPRKHPNMKPLAVERSRWKKAS